MICPKHPNAWIGLNGPGFCPVCASEREALGPSDATDCSEWSSEPTHTGWWLAWDVDGHYPYLLDVTDKIQPDKPALRVFFGGFWRVAAECTWAKWKPIIPPNVRPLAPADTQTPTQNGQS